MLLQQTLSYGLLEHLELKEWDPIEAITYIAEKYKNDIEYKGNELILLACNLVSIGRRILVEKIDVCTTKVAIMFERIVDAVSTSRGDFETSFVTKETYIYGLCLIYSQLYDPESNALDNSIISIKFIKNIIKAQKNDVPRSYLSELKILLSEFNENLSSIANIVVRPLVGTKLLPTNDCYFIDSSAALQFIPKDQVIELIPRIKTHIEFAPLYWQKIESIYKKVFINHHRNYEIVSALFESNLATIFENHFTGEEFKMITPVAWKIWIMSPMNRAYYLGFPVQIGCMNSEMAKIYLLDFCKLGPDKYADKMGKLGTSLIRPSPEGYQIKVFETNDDEHTEGIDDLSNEYTSYSPFDRIAYIENSRMYEFTRPSFERLIETRVNSYNRQPLSNTFIMTLTNIIRVAKEYDFPAAKPLLEHYENLKSEKADSRVEMSIHIDINNLAFHMLSLVRQSVNEHGRRINGLNRRPLSQSYATSTFDMLH
jgi:hypothetical protein